MQNGSRGIILVTMARAHWNTTCVTVSWIVQMSPMNRNVSMCVLNMMIFYSREKIAMVHVHQATVPAITISSEAPALLAVFHGRKHVMV